jgi:hypothetical protein
MIVPWARKLCSDGEGARSRTGRPRRRGRDEVNLPPCLAGPSTALRDPRVACWKNDPLLASANGSAPRLFRAALLALLLPLPARAGAPPGPSWTPPALPVDAIVPSDWVGHLGGSSQVTPAGDFAWSLPLWTAPSRGDTQPDLAITYSARGGNGVLGVGFGLSGLPEIRRCGQSIAVHGQVRGVLVFAGRRPFLLDGHPLALISGAYGKEGSEYRAERGGFDKFVFHKKGGRLFALLLRRVDQRWDGLSGTSR